MNKYYEIFKFNLKTRTNFKANYFFSLFSLAIHILVLSALWSYILQNKMILGYTKPELIWYVIIGELIVYTASRNYRKISDMVKSGDIANMLTKPVSFVKYIYAEEAACIVNVIVNIIFVAILGVVLAGLINLSLIQCIIFMLSLVISFVMYISVQVAIGLLAFITEENEAFYWIISKASLLLILTPLEFFPSVVQKVLLFLPTTYMIYSPSKIFVHFELLQSLGLMAGQVISLGVMFGIICLLSRKGVKNINVNGG